MTSIALESVVVPGRLGGISLTAVRGELVALVGPNGAGKSSLLDVARHGVRPASGEVLVDGKRIGSLSARERAQYIAWLPQRPGLPAGLTTQEVIAAARYRFEESYAASASVATRILQERGLEKLASRRMDRLSGGERQRVRFAALAAQEASFWLLDEPGNHLDPAHQVQLVSELVKEVDSGRGVLWVTHDIPLLALASKASTRVVGIIDGGIAFTRRLDDAELLDDLSHLFGVRYEWVESDGTPRICMLEGV